MTQKPARGLVRAALGAFALAAASGTYAAAVDLSTLLTNPSFENGNQPGGCPVGWTCTSVGTPPGGTAYTPTSAQYTAGSDGLGGGALVPDGTHAAYMPTSLAGSGSMSQTTGATWQAGDTYSFTFWVGLPNLSPIDGLATAWPETVRVMILANGVTDGLCGGGPCQMDIASPGSGQWKKIVYSFTPTQDFGQSIGVAFFESTSVNHQTVNFDIAPLTTQQVPEPGTLLLAAAGIAALTLGRRRKNAPQN